jgi:tetratricopeptide (TPR) repeat protein
MFMIMKTTENHWLMARMYYYLDKPELSRQSNDAWLSLASRFAPLQYQKVAQSGHDLRAGLIDLKEKNITSARSRLAETRSLIRGFSFPRDKISGRYSADFLEGEILLQEGKYDEAISLLERTDRPDFPGLSDSAGAISTNLLIDDLKARALEGKGDLDGAIAEYERLTTYDPKAGDRRLIYPKLHYRLGKLYEQKGLKAKAVDSYGEFLELWKDADPGMPEVEDARTRLAELKGETSH